MRFERFAIPMRPVTVDEVLAIIREHHRLQSHWDPEADPEAVLTFDTTVSAWRDACDLVGWKQLGHALNGQYRIAFSDAQWRAVLEPARGRTLKGVCEAIATTGCVERIEPVSVFGQSCVTAGAYLTARRVFEDAGVHERQLAPSSPLAPLLARQPTVLLRLARMAPGSLSMVEVRAPWLYDVAVTVLVLSMLMTFICWPFVGEVAPIFFIPFGLIAAIVLPFTGLLPSRVRTGALRDLRDLSYALAGEQPKCRRRRVVVR